LSKLQKKHLIVNVDIESTNKNTNNSFVYALYPCKSFKSTYKGISLLINILQIEVAKFVTKKKCEVWKLRTAGEFRELLSIKF